MPLRSLPMFRNSTGAILVHVISVNCLYQHNEKKILGNVLWWIWLQRNMAEILIYIHTEISASMDCAVSFTIQLVSCSLEA
jgi:hypothetical protein